MASTVDRPAPSPDRPAARKGAGEGLAAAFRAANVTPGLPCGNRGRRIAPVNGQREVRSVSVPAPAAIGPRRTALLAACVVAVGFVLTLALQSVHGHVGSPPKEHVFSAAVTYVALAAAGLALAAGLCLAAVMRMWRDEELGQRRVRVRWWERLVILLVYAAIAGVAVAALASLRRNAARGRVPIRGRHGVPRPNASPTAPEHVQWSFFAAVAIGALLGALVLAFLYRRESVQARRRPAEDDALARAATAGINELEAEPDPRRAVIRCYAAMEGSLRESGAPRLTAETPVEYLDRLLGGLAAGAEAAARLTPLFEQAKFSRHEIDEEMRQEALEAVRSLRRERAQ
jgi:hypothetical protein